MLSYDYIPVNGHVVAKIRGRNFLVDMGIPNTIAHRPLLLDGQKLEVTNQSHGLKLDDFNRLVGIELDGVLGSHLSNDYVISLLPDEKNLVLDKYQQDFPINIEVENLCGMPYMHQSIGNKRIRGLVAVGTAISWIQPELAEGFERTGRHRELFGYIGEREVDVCTLPVMVDKHSVSLNFGVMPPEVANWLKLANVDAVLGAELLEHYAISVALEEGTLSMRTLH